MSRADVLLDVRATRRMSIGMTAYSRELAARLPRVAPDLSFDVYARGTNFGIDEQLRLPAYAARTRPRFAHHTSVYAPFWMPCPSAITIHDLIHLRFPDQFKRAIGPYYRTVVRAACARATFVITDDARTVADLERLLGVDPRKVRVVPLGADDLYFEERPVPAARRPYFVYAGNHRAHKNLRTLVAAWRALPAGSEADLVFTGADDAAGLRAERAGGELRFAGDVAAPELAGLYRGAAAYVHPALLEGFGLPMLEAAAVGSRVLASTESVPAVLAGVAETFPAEDVRALSTLMLRALDDPLDDAARERRREAVRCYTWDRVAALTAEVYREALEESPAR